jgi:hypothetical protein
MPTLSEVRAYDASHLDAAAHHWLQQADQWTDTHTQVRSDAAALDWTGDGHDGLLDRVYRDYRVADHQSDRLRKASTIATHAAPELVALAQAVVAAADAAQQQGFAVGEDYSLTDTQSRSSIQRAGRTVVGRSLAADLAEQVEAFLAAEHGTASDLAQAGGL